MIRRILNSVSLCAIAALIAASSLPVHAYQAAGATGVAGVWKLNEAESNNPNGPASSAPQRGAKPPASGPDMTGGAARAGAGAQAISELSPEEKSRINRMLGLMNKAPQTLEIVVDGGNCTIKQDGSGFPQQNCDGKKFPLKNAQVGEVDIKIKIDAKGMTREISTQDGLKIVENYTLAADGQTMTVTMKASQPVMKIEDAKIKRVYQRK